MPILLLNLGHFLTHYVLLIYPTVVLSLAAQAGGGYGDLLLPSTAGFVAFAAMTLPAAWAGDRWPKERLMLLFFLGLAVGGAVAALAQDTAMLTIGLALLGGSSAIYHPVGIALLVERARSTGRAVGVNGVWGNLGVAAAPLGTAALTEGFGWPVAFAVPAAVALLLALVALGRQSKPSRAVGRAAARVAQDPEPLGRGSLWRIILFFVVGGFCSGLLFNVLTVALPKLVADALGSVGTLGPGALASAIFTVAAFSQLVSGRVLDRTTARRLAVVLTLTQAACAALLAATGGVVAVAMSLLLVTAIFAELPVGDTLLKRVTTPAVRARAYGLTYMVSFASSAAAVPLISGFYREGEGLGLLLWLLAGAAALLALAALALPRGAGAPERVAAATA